MVVAWAGGVAVAQTGGAAPAPIPASSAEPDAKLTELWSNFLHYILVARPDVAESHGKAILASNPDPRGLYHLSIRSRKSEATLATGRGMPRLKDTIDQIVGLISEGAVGVRKDPAEIARWIQMLAGTPRQFLMGRERLVQSGEYAVPQLIATLEDSDTKADLRQKIARILPALGKSAVRPLSESLQSDDPYVREVVARTLGQIGYAHAGPYLKELAERKGVLDRTRQVSEGALAASAGRAAVGKSVSELFYHAALKYYDRADSVMPDSRYDTANVWHWRKGEGLTYKAVPRVLFNEIYAMRCARKALAYDASFAPAVPLWVAASLRYEANGGKPTPDEPGAAYYARATGSKYLQAVLARALKDDDLPVAIGAIRALRETCTSQNMVKALDEQGGAQPLVSAMSSPARLVRYMAAETLALARPKRRFTGWPLVTTVLIEAVRQSGTPTAVLADPNVDRRNKVKDLLRGLGRNVIDADGLGEVLQTARDAGGADLAVISSEVTAPGPRGAVSMLRTEVVFSQLGVVLLSRPADMVAARAVEKTDKLTVVLSEEDADADGLKKALDELRRKGAGRTALTPDQSAEWAIRAADALKLLAETRTTVFDLTRATQSLITALNDKRDPVRIAAAAALGQFRAAQAQRALAALADDAGAGEPVRLAAYSALSESLRLFGNQLTEEQIKAVIDVVTAEGSLPIRSGAAQALGAMNLPAEKIKDLILSAK
ncbi:MAG: HEAT repeat domain-containing protein [Planctomycetota bacterium]|jgi:HEAT repeat protein